MPHPAPIYAILAVLLAADGRLHHARAEQASAVLVLLMTAWYGRRWFRGLA